MWPRSSAWEATEGGRGARAGLVLVGCLFVLQGAAKALDPVGYMAALESFHVLAPAALGALSLGALGLVWTMLELLAGVALLHGGLARAPARQGAMAGLLIALGLSFAYLTLDLGALVRHVPFVHCTRFGAFSAPPISGFVVAREGVVIALLAWLFTWLVRRSPRGSLRPPSRTSARAASRG